MWFFKRRRLTFAGIARLLGRGGVRLTPTQPRRFDANFSDEFC